MCFLPIHSGHQVRWTYQPGSHRISHPSFCGACLSFSREKESAIPFPRRLRSRNLCTNDLIVLHPLGIFSSKVGRAYLVSWSHELYFLFVLWSALTCLFCLNLLFLGTCNQVQHIFFANVGIFSGSLWSCPVMTSRNFSRKEGSIS